MVQTKGIHHVVLNVSNPQKSKEFYTKVCGLTFGYEGPEGIELWDDLFRLWLMQKKKSGKQGKHDETNIGIDHFAFQVATMKELKKIEKHLREMGVDMEEGGITDDGYPGTFAIFTTDPDGLKIEFHL